VRVPHAAVRGVVEHPARLLGRVHHLALAGRGERKSIKVRYERGSGGLCACASVCVCARVLRVRVHLTKNPRGKAAHGRNDATHMRVLQLHHAQGTALARHQGQRQGYLPHLQPTIQSQVSGIDTALVKHIATNAERVNGGAPPESCICNK
jgi:hypothetical protein